MVFGRIIDLRNNTTSDILVEDLGIVLPLNANATTTNVVRVTDFISVDEINFSADLEALLTSGDVSVNGTNGDGDGTAADNLSLADATDEITVTTTTATEEVAQAVGGGGATTILKAADETLNNVATLQDDDDFSFAVDANSAYFFEMWLVLEADAGNSDWQFAWTIPTGTTMRWAPDAIGGNRYWDASTTSTQPDPLFTEAGIVEIGSLNGGIHGVYLAGFIYTAGTSGTAQFQWAQRTAQASDNSILQDSVMFVRQLR